MKIISMFFSPFVFSIGFLTPLFAQLLLTSGMSGSSIQAYIIAAVVALSLGAMAQLRGTWIWVKS